MPTEDIQHLKDLERAYTMRLQVLDLQVAKYGSLDAPAHILIEKNETESQLQQVKQQLEQLRSRDVPSNIPSEQAEAEQLLPQIEEQLDQPQAPARAIDAPYRGLETFQEENAEQFFGRDALVATLVDKAGSAPFLAVLGPSGSGKSSVVRAGLIPALKRGGISGSEHWLYCPPFTPGPRPLNSLLAMLSSMPGGASLGSVIELQNHLATHSDTLVLAADALRKGNNGIRLVLLVDQGEELWTLAPAEAGAQANFIAEQQRPFIQQLVRALQEADSPVLVIFTMRADFLHRAAEHPDLAQAIGEHDVIVSPMTAEELRLAIVRPAEKAGLAFEHGLVNKLIEQTVQRAGALPLLEYTLLELWKRRDDTMLTWAAFDTLGGVEGALAARAEAILDARYPAPEQREQLRKVLLRLVQPGEGTADTRRRAHFEDLTPAGGDPNDVQALLKPLADARLLTTGYDTVSGDETVEVAHEALIRAWPTFSAWISDARADLRWQLQVEEAARDWAQSDENPGYLWSGLRLANAEAWVARARPALNARDQRFLERGRAAERNRQEQEEAARQRELEQERMFAQRLRRRAIYLAIALAVALGGAIAAGVGLFYANQSATLAQQQLDVAESLRLADLAHGQLGSTSGLDILLAYEAVARSATSQSRQVLYDALNQLADLAALNGHTGPVYTAVFSPDGQHILTASDDQTARLWDASGRPLVTLGDHTGSVTSAVFSPDGQRILTASDDQTARLWDTSGKLLATFTGHTGSVTSAVFSTDGQHILTASLDKTARLWDTSGKLLARLSGHTNRVTSAVFSPDGQHILTASLDKTARLWDMNGTLLATFSGHTGPVYTAVFSPDGQRILTASDDRTARLWDASGRPLVTLGDHTGPVYTAVFSPDGQRILTASDDQTARLWDTSGRSLATLTGHTGPVVGAAFSPDGQHLLTASLDSTARLWDLKGAPVATLSGHTRSVYSAVFSPDGKHILTASDDQTARQFLVDPNDLLALAACRVKRGLTAEEIARFQVPTPLKFDFARRQCPSGNTTR